MPLSLHSLSHLSQKKPRVRRGRGDASAGSYSGRGIKGQKARSGVSGSKERALRRYIQQIPKLRGFKSFKKKPDVVSLSRINALFNENDVISPKTLYAKHLIEGSANEVKIVHWGTLNKKLSFRECRISKGAHIAITNAGGTVEVP